MALKFFTACLLVARSAQLTEAACDMAEVQGKMTTCQTIFRTDEGDLCSRYNAYTRCVDDALASCPASVKDAFTSATQSASAVYSSQLEDCISSSGSGSGESENASRSGSNSSDSNRTTDLCSSTELQKKHSSCVQNLNSAAAPAGNTCGAWQAYECCLIYSFASCGSDMQGQISGLLSTMKTQFNKIAPGLAKCASATCSSGSGSGESEKPSGSGSNSGDSNQVTESCSSTELQKKGSRCVQNLNSAAAHAGNTCGAWHAYECCLKDSFASCGNDVQEQMSSMMSTMKTQFDKIAPGLAKCTSATCSSVSQLASPTPTEVETTIIANIQISDPLTFNVDEYAEAVKKATGVTQLPEAVVTAFEIVVKYVLPDATVMATAKAAIAKANDVVESQVQVTQSRARRLGAGRRLAMNVDVSITVPDKTKAAAVQASVADTGALESELGGAVSVVSAPVTTAKVETKVKSAPSVTGQLASQIENAGSDVGGTIKTEVKADAPQTLSNVASSNFRVFLAAVAILVRAGL